MSIICRLYTSLLIEGEKCGTADIALAAFFSLNEKGVYNLLSRDGYLAVYSLSLIHIYYIDSPKYTTN